MDESKSNSSKDTSSCNTELQSGLNFNQIDDQVQQLQEQNRKMQNEFNMQRAKLKELYIQKENEYRHCRAELELLKVELGKLVNQMIVEDLSFKNKFQSNEMSFQEQITLLHRLIQEIVQGTSNCKIELNRVGDENNKLRIENKELKEQQQDAVRLAPQVLTQVKKTIAKKLGADFGSGSNITQENDSCNSAAKRSFKDFENEDTEVLRSLVVHLQDEIGALKEKLRQTDEKLRICNESSKQDINNIADCTKISDSSTTCNLCEVQLNNLVEKNSELTLELTTIKKSLAEANENLKKEGSLRKVLEDQWQEKREAYKFEVQRLQKQVKCNEEQLLDLQQLLLETKEEISRNLQSVCDNRIELNKYLKTLQSDNDFLSGCYLATSEEIQNQYINLPNTVEELQEVVLKQQNEIIQARVANEFEKRKCTTSLDELQILRDQLIDCNNEQKVYERKLKGKIKSLQNELSSQVLQLQECETKRTALQQKEQELERSISAFRVEIIELQEENEKLKRVNADFYSKVKNLQDDLVTSEQVQKDFVKLSQTLQMSLEKLRHADTEVRWQDDEDIDSCPSCQSFFTVTLRKIHCRHCGHIFCDKCLTKTVLSGPRKRNARVCDICHTLLTPNIAPYFSSNPL